MKKLIAQLLLTVPVCVLLATVSSTAYTAPLFGPGGDSGEHMPVTIGATDQDKKGGLSVHAFVASSGAQFDQDVSFVGMIRGGTPSDVNSTVTFGNTSASVGVKIAGLTAIDGKFQSDALKTGGGEKPLCAKADGTIYLCGSTNTTPPPTAQTDVCPNLAGIQANVPSGMTKDSSGDCVLLPTIIGYEFDSQGTNINDPVQSCGINNGYYSCSTIIDTTKREYPIKITLDKPLITQTIFTVKFDWRIVNGFSKSGTGSIEYIGNPGDTIINTSKVVSIYDLISFTDYLNLTMANFNPLNSGIGIDPRMVPVIAGTGLRQQQIRAYCLSATGTQVNIGSLNGVRFSTIPLTKIDGAVISPAGAYSPVGISCQ